MEAGADALAEYYISVSNNFGGSASPITATVTTVQQQYRNSTAIVQQYSNSTELQQQYNNIISLKFKLYS